MNPWSENSDSRIHALIRGNNRVWSLMYYDELVETDHYQLSSMAGADADYYNCAQAVTELNESQLAVIELFYRTRNLVPAFYLDPLNQSWLEPFLVGHGYGEEPEEVEHWWALDLDAATIQRLSESQPLKLDPDRVRIIPVDSGNAEDFNRFIRVDQEANDLSEGMTEKLARNLLTKSLSGVQNHLFLGLVDDEPAFTGSLGIVEIDHARYGFLAEGGTLVPFRSLGLHRAMIRERALFAADQQVDTVCFTCTKEAISNHTGEQMGMTLAFKRPFWKKG